MASPDLRISLHGDAPEEQHISITATRDGQSHDMVFAPGREYHTVFPNQIIED